MKETGQRVQLPTDQVKARLEQLDDSKTEEEQDMEVTQQDYINHIETLHTELSRAWGDEKRVKSLKIAIQCAKLLSDTTVIKFYPSKWVLVTEILDTFGELVFKRIRQRSLTYDKSGGAPKALPKDFKLSEVSEEARETCRNWFYKIASIRELLPRMFIEMSILECYRFLTEDSFQSVIDRLCSMMRGIGDLLVATSARAYLARVAQRVAPGLTDHLMTAFCDHVNTLQLMQQKRPDGSATKLQQVLSAHSLERAEYFELFTPSVEWLMECLAARANKDTLAAVLRKYKDSNDALTLNHIVSNFPPALIASNAVALTSLINACDDSTFPRTRLFASLGLNLVLCAPPQETERLAVLNEVWKAVTDVKDPEAYMTVAEVFVEFTAQHFRSKEVNTMLADILAHVRTEDQAYERLQPQLQATVEKVLAHIESPQEVFAMDSFMPLLDLFRGAEQVDVSKSILRHFSRFSGRTSDPVIINTMFSVCSIVHDSVNTLTFADEVRQITQLITAFVGKVTFGRDFEKQMNFYVDCRRAFSNLDKVKRALVLGVCNLAMSTHRIIGGKHTKKTSAFVRACVAFCYITIPAMEETLDRLHLYVLAAQIALANQSVHQAEALFEAAIMLVPEVPTHLTIDGQVVPTETRLLHFLAVLSSALLPMPGHPEMGPFALQRKLLDALKQYPWAQATLGGRPRAVLLLLRYFVAVSFEPNPPGFRVPKVESNIYLFGGDSEYHTQLYAFVSEILDVVKEDLEQLALSKDVSARNTRADVANDLLDLASHLFEPTPDLLQLAQSMRDIAQSAHPNNKYSKNILQSNPSFFQFNK